MVHDYDDYDDDEDRRGSRWLKVVVICLVGALVAGGGFWLVTRNGQSDTAPVALDDIGGGDGTDPVTAPPALPTSAAPTSEATASSAAPTTGTVAASTPLATAVVVQAVSGPVPPTDTGAASTPPATTTAPGAPPTETAAPATLVDAAGPGYPTSTDGSPLPVILTYAPDSITLTGFVPSQAAKDRIGLLATANSKTEAPLHNNLVVNPQVPIGVGVRVIELDSVRFPDGSAEILPEHATELERVARVMEALPNVTALVIGHADQRGDAAENFAISAERAAAVVDFLTYLGVSPTRLSSRAAGEADLLTLEDDATALALNRRTEFVFYGILIE